MDEATVHAKLLVSVMMNGSENVQEGNHILFHVILEVTYHYFCCILY